MTIGRHHPGTRGQPGPLVGPVVEGCCADYKVECRVAVREVLGGSGREAQPIVARGPLGDVDHGVRRVYANQLVSGGGLRGELTQQIAGPAPHVKDTPGRRNASQGELRGAVGYLSVQSPEPAILVAWRTLTERPNVPDSECNGKIKQAYGLAFDQKSRLIAAQKGMSSTQRQQTERDAGRKAEIATVKEFLGGVPIDHFVEVTLVAFYQIAQVVQPITVCVNENTQDSYSGANFHKGYQQINASQAMAFVRQRGSSELAGQLGSGALT